MRLAAMHGKRLIFISSEFQSKLCISEVGVDATGNMLSVFLHPVHDPSYHKSKVIFALQTPNGSFSEVFLGIKNKKIFLSLIIQILSKYFNGIPTGFASLLAVVAKETAKLRAFSTKSLSFFPSARAVFS